MLLKLRCRKCKKEYPASGPTSHFKPRRKTCKTCLEGIPPPLADDDYVVVRRPRAVRRKWPKFVRAHLKRYRR